MKPEICTVFGLYSGLNKVSVIRTGSVCKKESVFFISGLQW